MIQNLTCFFYFYTPQNLLRHIYFFIKVLYINARRLFFMQAHFLVTIRTIGQPFFTHFR